MLMFVGDVHGNFAVFNRLMSILPHDTPMTIIQVGDFGFYPGTIDRFPKKFPWKLYAIDGNHEYFPMIRGYNKVSEVRENLYFVPRGTVMNLEGYELGFMGGAFSVDKNWRSVNVDWFSDETIIEDDIAKLYGKKLDLLVTHSPPKSLIDKHFGVLDKASWGLKLDDEDTSAPMIQKLWEKLEFPPIIMGHMHRAIKAENYRFLDVNEGYVLPPKSDNRLVLNVVSSGLG